MSNFGQEIKRLRLASGLTQVELAGKLEVTQGAVASLESGRKTGVSVGTLYKLSDALGVKPDHWRPFLADAPGAEIRTPAKKRKRKA